MKTKEKVLEEVAFHKEDMGLAGSGKSNSITWAAYRLIETYPAAADIRGAKDVEQPLFDSVIVVTDRRLLGYRTTLCLTAKKPRRNCGPMLSGTSRPLP
ncbi:MAG: hypothetical protein U5K27_09660 [Desulfotignum sp.]|nr:hypothetical protein [Desulfotignum sp.]